MLLPERNCKLIVGVLYWFKPCLIVVLGERSVTVAVHMADISGLLIPSYTFLVDIFSFPIHLYIFLLLDGKEVNH
jgi:hypothetical protein